VDLWIGVTDRAAATSHSFERVSYILETGAEALTFDWDSANTEHIARHKVTPAEAEQVLINDPEDLDFAMLGEEERWTGIGHTNRLRILLVVWTIRRDAVRVVTVWDAPPALKKAYLRRKGVA